ncbi:MAG: RNA pseudouridine synthase [Bacteroidia bacterium]|nr:RNA pseudouridine synthase [Bacteroidia bacterium]
MLFEDNHLIAVNKPSGVLVQGDNTGDLSLDTIVKQYIKEKYNKPGDVFLGVIHRIDRPVSGVILYGRTSKALTRMNEQFKNKEVKKVYWAVCKNRPEDTEGHLVNHLRKNAAQNKSFVCKKDAKGSQKAELNYEWINQSNNFNLFHVELLTGRHHQIRAQLAHIGCPIKGDLKYGAKRSNPDGSIHLHARSISFMHPVKKESITITAKAPQESLWNFFEETETKR